MRRLVIADVNETILPPRVDVPSPATIDVVTQMHEQGTAFVPVTSLSIPFIGSFAEALNLQDMGVLDGGATVYNFAERRRDPELSRWLTPETARHVVGSISTLYSAIYYDQLSQERTPETADINEINDPVPSVFVIFDNTRKAEIMGKLRDIPGISADPNRYDNSEDRSCVQIVCRGVSKASGVRIVRSSEKYRDLEGSDMLIIGDGDPDIKMFKAMPPGTLRVAMASGSLRLQRLPGVLVAPPVEEEGFVTIMREHVLR